MKPLLTKLPPYADLKTGTIFKLKNGAFVMLLKKLCYRC